MFRYFLIWALATGILWLLFTYLREAPKSHLLLLLKCAASSTAAALLLYTIVLLF